MYILGLDVETTGLDVNTCEIIEVGAVLWDTQRQVPMIIFSELVQLPEGQVIPEEITQITGIQNDDLNNFAKPKEEVLSRLIPLMGKVDYIMAHNASFDKSFIHKALNEFSSIKAVQEVLDKTWIDSLTDIPYPESVNSRKLGYLAADHQFLNYYSHRAVFDVLTMLKIAAQYDINEIISLNASPNLTVKAVVSFEEKDKAKARGYRWDAKNRIWVKNLKEVHLEKERQSCDFELAIL